MWVIQFHPQGNHQRQKGCGRGAHGKTDSGRGGGDQPSKGHFSAFTRPVQGAEIAQGADPVKDKQRETGHGDYFILTTKNREERRTG
ncbi:hypothetical protein AA18889_1037 [Acetobacter senegalensis DSM 18889]|nr:hypothetical protein AA18889_1037 [Acetobacter senegalensis DSM 18889]